MSAAVSVLRATLLKGVQPFDHMIQTAPQLMPISAPALSPPPARTNEMQAASLHRPTVLLPLCEAVLANRFTVLLALGSSTVKTGLQSWLYLVALLSVRPTVLADFVAVHQSGINETATAA